jgi:hypothetical protein
MPVFVGIIALVAIYLTYKMFVDGWLWKIILFFAGWVGMDVLLRVYAEGSKNTAITFSNGASLAWAELIPTVICLLALMTTRVKDD